jgi:hypothetical protein
MQQIKSNKKSLENLSRDFLFFNRRLLSILTTAHLLFFLKNIRRLQL